MTDDKVDLSIYIGEIRQHIEPYLSLTERLGIQLNDKFSCDGKRTQKLVYGSSKKKYNLTPKEFKFVEDTIITFQVLLAAQNNMLCSHYPHNYHRVLQDLYDSTLSAFSNVRDVLKKRNIPTRSIFNRTEKVRENLNNQFYPFHIHELERFLESISHLDSDLSLKQKYDPLLAKRHWFIIADTRAQLARLDEEYELAFDIVRVDVLDES